MIKSWKVLDESVLDFINIKSIFILLFFGEEFVKRTIKRWATNWKIEHTLAIICITKNVWLVCKLHICAINDICLKLFEHSMNIFRHINIFFKSSCEFLRRKIFLLNISVSVKKVLFSSYNLSIAKIYL